MLTLHKQRVINLFKITDLTLQSCYSHVNQVNSNGNTSTRKVLKIRLDAVILLVNKHLRMLIGQLATAANDATAVPRRADALPTRAHFKND